MLDKTDRKILSLLDRDSRVRNVAIAKGAGITKQLLKYRLNRLLEAGVIERFYTVVNGVKLGMSYFRVYLRLQGLDASEEEMLLSRIASNEYVTWVIRCRGTWDVIFSIYAENAEQYSENFGNIVGEYQKNVLEKKTAVIRNVIFSTRDYLRGGEKEDESVYGGITEKLAIDDLDHRLLVEMNRDCRQTLLSLAKKAKTTPETVRSRLSTLTKMGITKANKLAINYQKTGVFFFLISMNLSSVSTVSRKKLENFCMSHPNVIYYTNLIGDHDADLEVEVESQDEIDKLIRDLRNKFPDIIRDLQPVQVIQQYKIELYPFKKKPT